MTASLFSLSRQVARALYSTIEGEAEGGTTTTLLDTRLKVFRDNYFNGGSVWILKTTDGLAPQGEVAMVQDFAMSSGTITHSALSIGVDAGDRYAVCPRKYNYDLLTTHINRALDETIVPFIDTSLTAIADTHSYTIPMAFFDNRIGVFTSSDGNVWTEHFQFKVEWDGTNTKLVFPSLLTVGDTIKLEYRASMPNVWSPSDEIRGDVAPEIIVYKAALHAILEKKIDRRDKDPDIDPQIQHLTSQLNKALWRSPHIWDDYQKAYIG